MSLEKKVTCFATLLTYLVKLHSFWIIWSANKIDLEKQILQITKKKKKNRNIKLTWALLVIIISLDYQILWREISILHYYFVHSVLLFLYCMDYVFHITRQPFCLVYGMLAMWDVGDVGFWACGMFKIWVACIMGCWEYGRFGMWGVYDVGCLGYWMFWTCWMFEMWVI